MCNKKLCLLLIIATIFFVNQISADVVKGILLGSLIASKYQNRINFVPMPYFDYLTQLENKLEDDIKVFNQYSHHTNTDGYATTVTPVSTTTSTPSTTTTVSTSTPTYTRPTYTTTTMPSTTSTTTTSMPTSTTTSPHTTTTSSTTTSSYDYAKELVMILLNPENISKAKPYRVMPESIQNDFESWLLSEIASDSMNHHEKQEVYHDNSLLELDLSGITHFEPTALGHSAQINITNA